jgi:hypothetical protein
MKTINLKYKIIVISLFVIFSYSVNADEANYCHQNCDADMKECRDKANTLARRQTSSLPQSAHEKDELHDLYGKIKSELNQKCETEKNNCQQHCLKNTATQCCNQNQEIKLPK